MDYFFYCHYIHISINNIISRVSHTYSVLFLGVCIVTIVPIVSISPMVTSETQYAKRPYR